MFYFSIRKYTLKPSISSFYKKSTFVSKQSIYIQHSSSEKLCVCLNYAIHFFCKHRCDVSLFGGSVNRNMKLL